MNPPGRGQSKKARARARKRSGTTTITTTTQQTQLQTPSTQSVQNTTKKNRRSRRNGKGRISNNDYLENLKNPDICVGCKIPDPFTCIGTGTFRLSTDFAFTTVAANNGNYAIEFDPNSMMYAAGNSATTGGVFTYSTANMPGLALSQQLYSQWRVVSAYVQVYYTGTTMNDSGTLIGYWTQGNTSTPNASTNSAMQIARSQVQPLKVGCRVMYLPMDNSDIQFNNANSFGGVSRPRIGFAAFGLTTGQSVQVRIVANYEGIAASDVTDFIKTESSPTRMDQFLQAMKFGQSVVNTVIPLVGGWSQVANTAAQLLGAGLTNRSNRIDNSVRGAAYNSMPLITELS